MLALSIRQPWAWLIVHGFKDIENRTWSRPYRGRLFVHTGKKPDPNPGDAEWAFMQAAYQSGRPIDDLRERYEREKVFGALVGTVMVQGCVSHSDSAWFFGPFGFVLKEPVAWRDPVPYKGARGLFLVREKELEHYAEFSEAGR